MAGIKAKISNLLHKDKDPAHNDGVTSSTHTHEKHTTGYDTTPGHTSTSHTSTTPGHTSTSHTSATPGTTTGTTGHTSTTGVGEARTGMSDMDLNKTTGTGVGHTSTYGTERTSGTGMATTGTTGDVSQGVTRQYDSTTNEIIDQERFTKTEDHEVVVEKKAYELEHRPVEKKYVVETKYMGERAVPGRPTELLSTDAREVEERVVEMPRGDRTIVVENVDVPIGMESAGRAINEHSTSGLGTTTTGTGYSDRDNLGTSGTGLGHTGTGYSDRDNLGTSGTGLGHTGTGTGTTGTGYTR